MSAASVIIAQISDLHICEPGRLFAGLVDTAKMTLAAVEHLNRLDPAPDLVLITGDLVDSGQSSQYGHLLELIAAIEAPVRLLPGNHDDREIVRATLFPDTAPGSRLSQVVDVGPLLVILLDDVIAGSPSGLLGNEQIAWLDARLSEQPRRPTIVALHHPPFPTGIEHMDEMGLIDAAALGSVIERHHQVERVITGHLHRPIATRWAGTIAVTAPSVAHQVTLDLRAGSRATFTLEPPAHLLHRWSANGGFVTHVSYIGEFGGSHQFPH